MFGSLGNMMSLIGNMNKIAKEYKDKMEQLKGKTVQASAGADQVIVTANGLGEITQIKIAQELASGGDAGMIEELTLSAVNNAVEKAKELMQQEMGALKELLPMDQLQGLLGKLPM
jgi:DNA-binding YbaB/EbfC family protein